MKFERSISNSKCLENNKSANFDVKYTAKDFSAYFSNLTENIMSKLPTLEINMVCFQQLNTTAM